MLLHVWRVGCDEEWASGHGVSEEIGQGVSAQSGKAGCIEGLWEVGAKLAGEVGTGVWQSLIYSKPATMVPLMELKWSQLAVSFRPCSGLGWARPDRGCCLGTEQ